MIRIMAPVNETCDLDKLSLVADEFYAGLADEEWIRMTNDSVYYNTRGNRAGNANYHSIQTLSEMIGFMRRRNKTVYLTVNSHNIDRTNFSVVKRIIRDFAQMGGSGIICSELNGLKYAEEAGLKAALSTNMAIYNIKALEYLCKDYKVDRVVLSRDLTLEEICKFREMSNLEIEVFGMNFGCKFSNGHCLGSHNHEKGGICSFVKGVDWRYENPEGEMDLDFLYDTEINHFIYSQYFMNQACGLCSLYEFNQIGIDSFKIVGRELSGDRILSCAEQVMYCRDAALDSLDKKEFLEKMKDIKSGRTGYGCKWGYQCYYPEVRQRDRG